MNFDFTRFECYQWNEQMKSIVSFVTLRLICFVQRNKMFIFKNQIGSFDSRKQDNEHVFQKENDPV